MKLHNLAISALAIPLAALLATAAYGTQGVSDTEIMLGSHLALSGPVALWGVPFTNGMRMRADEVNAAGGIHGRKIHLISEDNAYQQSKAAQAGDKLLKRDKVFAIIGSGGTPQALVVMPEALKLGVLNLFPLTAAKEMYEPYNKFNFSMFTPYYYQIRAGVSYFAKEKGYTRIGVLYQDDDFGYNILSGARDQAKAIGVNVVSETSYKRGSKDFSSQIAKLKADGAQLVLLGTIISETIGAKVEARKLGWNVDMMATTAGYTTEVAELSKGAADGLYAAAQFVIIYPDQASTEVAAWMKRYETQFGKPPTLQAYAGYTAMDLFSLGAQNAGRNLTAESMAAGIEAIKGHKNLLTDIPYTFSVTKHIGPPENEAMLAQVKGERWVTLRKISF